jgi:periplasmic divalent cation tolerance protein
MTGQAQAGPLAAGDFLQVQTTTDSRAEAMELARTAVEARLAAAAQVAGPITTTYWWEGEIESAEEWMVLFKTTTDCFEDLAAQITEQHSYDTPEIIATPVVAAGLWLAYVVSRLGGVPGHGPSRGAFGPPFLGLSEAIRASWLKDPWAFVVNVALLIVVILFVPVTVRSRLPIAWGALPFAALAVFLSAEVWRETFDLARAVAPIFTAAPFAVLSMAERERLDAIRTS